MTCAVEWRIASMGAWAPASSSSSAEPRSGRVERRLVLVHRRRRVVCLVVCHRRPPENHRNLPSRQDERFDLPRFHPPSRPPGLPRAVVRSCRANGRIPGRFTGRSRVVPSSLVSVAGLQPMAPALWRRPGRGRVPLDALLVSMMVGDTGLEPVTSCMSSMRSNQLS